MNFRRLKIFFAVLVLFLGLDAWAQETGSTDSLLVSPLPSYVRLLSDGDSCVSLPDSIFDAIAGRVIFKVNRTELRPNSPLLSELSDVVIPYVNAKGWMLQGIDLRGAASPEGPYWNNVRLSKGRAKALRDFLTEHLDSVATDDIMEQTIAEDYPYLLYLMQEAGDADAYQVEQIIADCGIENMGEIKKRLMKIDGGKLWKRLLHTYYPTVRAARLVLFFKEIYPEPLHIDPQPVPRLGMVGLRPALGYEFLPIDVVLPLGPFERIVERPHFLSLSSNLLYDAFYMPDYGMAPALNVAVEFFPKRGNWTYRFGFTEPYYHKWDKHKFFQIRDYHFEARRYFRPGFYHTGTYLGAYVNNAKYGIGLSDTKGWQGEGLGAALKVGYVLPLGDNRWRLDFHAAAGVFYTRFDPYVWGNPITGEIDNEYYYDWVHGSQSFRRRNHQLTWFGPTEIGVTLSYDLMFHRLQKRGVSFKRKEVVR